MGCICNKLNSKWEKARLKFKKACPFKRTCRVSPISTANLEAGDSDQVTVFEDTSDMYAAGCISRYDRGGIWFREGDTIRESVKRDENTTINEIRSEMDQHRRMVRQKAGKVETARPKQKAPINDDLVIEDLDDVDLEDDGEKETPPEKPKEEKSLLGNLPPLVPQPLAGFRHGSQPLAGFRHDRKPRSALELVELEEKANSRPRPNQAIGWPEGPRCTLRGSTGALRRSLHLAKRKKQMEERAKLMEQRAIEESKERLRARKEMYANAMAAAKQRSDSPCLW